MSLRMDQAADLGASRDLFQVLVHIDHVGPEMKRPPNVAASAALVPRPGNQIPFRSSLSAISHVCRCPIIRVEAFHTLTGVFYSNLSTFEELL